MHGLNYKAFESIMQIHTQHYTAMVLQNVYACI